MIRRLMRIRGITEAVQPQSKKNLLKKIKPRGKIPRGFAF